MKISMKLCPSYHYFSHITMQCLKVSLVTSVAVFPEMVKKPKNILFYHFQYGYIISFCTFVKH